MQRLFIASFASFLFTFPGTTVARAHGQSFGAVRLVAADSEASQEGDTSDSPIDRQPDLPSPRAADPSPNRSAEGIPPLRIGLRHDFAGCIALRVSSDSPFEIVGGGGTVLARCDASSVYRIGISGSGIQIADTRLSGNASDIVTTGTLTISASAGSPLKLFRADKSEQTPTTHSWHQYRGELSVAVGSGASSLSVVDTVGLEEYLYSVVPAEIGAHAPLAAMEAQAIAARTYALKYRGKCEADGYDMDDTTRCEGYLGAGGETPLTTMAVDNTRGQILTYDGELIDALYSTDCGGMTACDPTGQRPYLQAVRDAPSPQGPDYASGCPMHSWTVTISKEKIAALFASDTQFRLTQFENLTIGGLDASGRIATATATSVGGIKVTLTGPELRRVLGYDVLRSTRATMAVTAGGDYLFTGWGWGHGMGLSQLGAIAMASEPYGRTCQDILAHYYVGAKIADAGTVNLPPVKTAQRAF